MEKGAYSVKDVMFILSLGKTKVYELIEQGVLEVIEINKKPITPFKILASSVNKLLKKEPEEEKPVQHTVPASPRRGGGWVKKW